MKNLIFYLLLPCFFLLGNSPVDAGGFELGGVAEVIIQDKGSVVHSFYIPSKYLTEGNKLILPVEVTLIGQSKTIAFNTQSEDLNIIIPNNLSGSYLLTVSIGDFFFSKKVVL